MKMVALMLGHGDLQRVKSLGPRMRLATERALARARPAGMALGSCGRDFKAPSGAKCTRPSNRRATAKPRSTPFGQLRPLTAVCFGGGHDNEPVIADLGATAQTQS
jgi:hypothetical protein